LKRVQITTHQGEELSRDKEEKLTPDKKKYYAYLAALSAARAEVLSAPASFSLSSVSAAATAGVESDGAKIAGLDSQFNRRPLLYTVADLEAVSKTKMEANANGEKALTIMHLCGNKWCLEASHLFVGSKAFNDNQVHCHFGLHSTITLEEYLQVQASFCKHKPKCWALPYKGVLDTTAKFVETGLPEA
jgi:hypothetical protein